MPNAKFKSKVILGGKTATGFEVPAAVVSKLGTGKRPPVAVTINGFTYRSTVAAYRDKFFLPLSAENRNGAGVAAGDTIEVSVVLDSAPREVVVPPDFAKALAKVPAAKKFFESLSFSGKRGHVDLINGAKTEETRTRRIKKSIERLRRGEK